jgi:hypothetical protein
MTEIKSTLDLIMEKTKGLSMTPQEKEALRREEWLKKAKGWIQKFLEGWVDLEKIKDEIDLNSNPPEWEFLLKKEIITGLHPEAKNEKRLQLLQYLLHLSPDPYLKVFDAFNRRIEQEKNRQENLLRQNLADQGISGAAVLPNLDLAPSWRRFYQLELENCQRTLSDL